MKLRTLIFAAAVVAPEIAVAQSSWLPSPEPAPPLGGLYIGAGVGVNWLQNQHLVNTSGQAVNGSISSNVGMVGVASLGYALSNGLRFELEGDLRNNPIHGAHDLGFPATAGGRERKYGPMFNVLYDFGNLLPVPYFSPYVGVGVGYQWARMSGLHVNGTGGFPAFTSGDTTGAIAYQFILGGAVPIPAVRGLALTAEYRFLGVGSRTYDVASQAAPGTPVLPGRVKLGNDFNHALLIGLRYNFSSPPPAAPPAPIAAPAPAPARSYLVFFDWDKATLSDRARQIIKEAADNSTRVQYTRIEVNGYTDTSGTKQYNQGLSVRRAQAVQAELVRNGVPMQSITIQGFGDTNLLVPTGPGVREPQNRRVEIIIR